MWFITVCLYAKAPLHKLYQAPLVFSLSTVSSSVTGNLIFHTQKFPGWGHLFLEMNSKYIWLTFANSQNLTDFDLFNFTSSTTPRAHLRL